MNYLLKLGDFVNEDYLSSEKKVNILFEDFKSTLYPLFKKNNLFYGEKNLLWSKKEERYDNNIIFENKWFINNNFCEFKGLEFNKKNILNDDFLLSEGLNLSQFWYARYIYNLPKCETIGILIRLFYYSNDLGKSSYTLIKFNKNVYCSEKEKYTKGDIIVFDKYNRTVRPTKEDEITDILKNKKKFMLLDI